MAADYLEKRGFTVLCRNFRCRSGEIDLVARDGRTLVFVEVKYRRSGGTGLPEEAVSPRKMRTISRVADFYRVRFQVPENVPCRFDVIAIEGTSVRYYRDAFPYMGAG